MKPGFVAWKVVVTSKLRDTMIFAANTTASSGDVCRVDTIALKMTWLSAIRVVAEIRQSLIILAKGRRACLG